MRVKRAANFNVPKRIKYDYAQVKHGMHGTICNFCDLNLGLNLSNSHIASTIRREYLGGLSRYELVEIITFRNDDEIQTTTCC